MLRYAYWRLNLIRTGSPVPRLLDELIVKETLSVDEQLLLQEQRLGALLRHSCQYVPYYREKFRETGITNPRDIRGSSALKAFPIRDRSILRANRDWLLAENIPCKSRGKDKIEFNFKPVTHIDKTATGKHKIVVNKLTTETGS